MNAPYSSWGLLTISVETRRFTEVSIQDKALRRPSEIRGGEQQRVPVTRSLVKDPVILLGDEPAGNLDTKNTRMIAGLLEELNMKMGKTFVLITHNPEVSGRTRRVVYLGDGRIEKEGSLRG